MAKKVAKKKVSKKRVIRNRFLRNFSEKILKNIFDKRIFSKDNAGIDGIHAHDFKQEESVEIINRKVSVGTYRFTSYAEIQIAKGRGKLPRILALATVRDQITLSALKDYLHGTFPEAVNRTLPNSYVFALKKEIQKIKVNNQPHGFIHTDISGFYDNIDREKLMNFVRDNVSLPQALKLIYRAIANPIVPRNSRRKQRFHYYSPKGVPQGLAISNILAGIYMANFDKTIRSLSLYYIRYVDDILLLCPVNDISQNLERLHFEVSKLGLKLNEDKTRTGIVGKDSFIFLGYKIKTSGLISVRDNSIHRKIIGLANKISSADHKRDSFTRLHSIEMVTYRRVLIEDINEQITGAVSDSKRYGWIFYFSQINDISLLYHLDRIVEKLCKRCRTFRKRKPKDIKSFVTSFKEVHKLVSGSKTSYIPHYDDLDERQKIGFLKDRGLFTDPEKSYTKEKIKRLFKATLRKRMLNLEKDIGDTS